MNIFTLLITLGFSAYWINKGFTIDSFFLAALLFYIFSGRLEKYKND